VQLRRVEVRNIRSYRHARLDLTGGTTLLVGDVGSGKTSLLYAVEMALFGTAEIEATFLVRHGSSEATVSVTLEDDGHLYEIERAFRRVRRKGRETFEPGRLSFRRDGATTSYSATELRQQVIELLGFRDNPNPRAHSDLWRWAVYVPQEQMREILSAPPAERLETVRKALGVERYRLAAENAKEAARDLRQSATAYRDRAETLRRFSEDFERAANEVRRLEGERERIESALRAAEAGLVQLRQRSAEVDLALQALESVRTRLGDLARDATLDRRRAEESERRSVARRQELEQVDSELEELAALVADQPRRATALADWERSVTAQRGEVERASVAEANWAGAQELQRAREAERTRYVEDVERLRSEVDRKRTVLSEVEGEGIREPLPPSSPLSIAEIEAALDTARRAEQAAAESAAVARRALGELEELVRGGVCPRCHQSVRPEEFATHQAEGQSAVSQSVQRVQATRAESEGLERLRRQREAYDRALAAWLGHAQRRGDLETAIREDQQALSQSEGRLRLAGEAVAEADRQATALAEAARSIGPARERLAEAQRKADSARGALEASGRAAERRGALTERLESLRREEERSARESEETERRRRERDVEVLGLKERLSNEAEARQAAQSARAALGVQEAERHRLAEERGRLAGLWQGALNDQRRAEAARVERDRLLHEAETVDSKAAWLSTAFHEAVLTMEKRVLEHAQAEFEHTFRTYFGALMDDPDLVAVTDSTFSPSAEIRGVGTPAEALSGGERTSLALAYRLALSRVVRSLGGLRFDALLLDEPTDGFSPEQVQSMGQLLEELRLPQVLLVSHERELESVADRVVRVEKEGGVSVLRDPRRPADAEAAAGEPAT